MVFSMIKDKGILIKNIYYMLTYAFRVLKQSNFKEIASEEFENIHNLFAALLAKGIAQQLKQGLYRKYVTKHGNLSVMRGKFHIHGTINNMLQRKQMLSCEYDEFSENNIFNQILKTTALILLRQSSVNLKQKTALKKVMPFFDNIDIIEPTSIKWNMLKFQRNNQNYKMLLNVCYFVLNSLLLTTDKGKYKLATFLDDISMSSLFEKFVLEYYRYHYPMLHASSAQIRWNVDDVDNKMISILPIMQTDIMLKNKGKTLIIDTKYYSRILQTQYDKQTLHSNNLYQIFAYVKNQDMGNTGDVAGMLLYAKTNESIAPNCDFQISGNKISVRTLDLNVPFQEIAEQLNKIATSYFDI